jgi:hypothetical protein
MGFLSRGASVTQLTTEKLSTLAIMNTCHWLNGEYYFLQFLEPSVNDRKVVCLRFFLVRSAVEP